NGDQVFPALIVNFLPVGLVGLVIAGLIAAIMSTIDSTLNSASTLVMYDFVGEDKRGWSPKRIGFVGRVVTALFIVVAALWPLVIRDFPGLFNYIQQVFSYAVPPIAAVFLLGVFWTRMTGPAALATLLVGHGIGAGVLGWKIWIQAQGLADTLPHFTIVAGLTTGLCLVVGVLASWITAPPDEARRIVWNRGDLPAAAKGLLDYRWQAAAIVVVVAAIVWIWRERLSSAGPPAARRRGGGAR